MMWECSECGGCIERDRPPRLCGQCGTAGVIFTGVDRADADESPELGRETWLRAGMSWPPRWVMRGAVGVLVAAVLAVAATAQAHPPARPPAGGPKPAVIVPKRTQPAPVPSPKDRAATVWR